ncbi:MAG: hypothetical protein D6820_01150, partial [Lentisphaerae bacterium]
MNFIQRILTVMIIASGMAAAAEKNKDVPAGGAKAGEANADNDFKRHHFEWIIFGSNEYAFNLYRAINQTRQKNFVLAPFALTRLQYALTAAAKAGTLSLIRKVGNIQVEPNQMFEANKNLCQYYYNILSIDASFYYAILRFWLKLGRKPRSDFVKLIMKDFPSGDFKLTTIPAQTGELKSKIDAWSKLNTRGFITDVLDDLTIPDQLTFFATTIAGVKVPWLYRAYRSRIPLVLPATGNRKIAWPMLVHRI